MITGNENNSSQDKRGLFVRFLNPLWQGLTNKANTHNGIIGSISKELDKTLADMIDSKKESWLDTADGTFLNHWGEFVGVHRRPNESDDEYRARIKKYITVLRGTIPAIKDALYDYFGDYDAQINIYEPHVDIFYTNKSLLNGKDHLQGEYYRYAVIDVSIDRSFDYNEVMAIIDKFKPAGVMVVITHNPSLNKNIGIVYGFYEELGARSLITEVHSFTGYKATKRSLMTLSTSSVMSDNDLFILNQSDLNSTDVLAGGSNGGRTSFHGVFVANDITPTTNNTVLELLGMGTEVDPMIYTATGFSGGARVPVELGDNEYMYQAIDMFEYHYRSTDDVYASKQFKYIKIIIDNSNTGMDLGYLTALNGEGEDVAVGAKWSVAVNGKGSFDVYNNGDNITNTTDRVSYATLVLESPSDLKSIQIDNPYGGTGSNGGIYVSEDGEEYYNVYYGELDTSTYIIEDATTALTEGSGYGKFLSNIYSNMFMLLYMRTAQDSTVTTVDIMNFDTNEWDTLEVKEGYNLKFEKMIPSNLGSYLSSSGLFISRVSTNTPQEIQIDFSTLSVVYNRGFRYLLDFGLRVESSRPSIHTDNDEMDLVVPQVYVEGGISETGKYYTPFRRIRLEVEESTPDPNLGKYFRMSGTSNETDTSPLEGFDAGKLLGESSSGEVGGVTALLSRLGGIETLVDLKVEDGYATLDLEGWALDITSIKFTGGSYSLLTASVNNYRQPNLPFLDTMSDRPSEYILSTNFFKPYYPLSKTIDGHTLEDYTNNPNLFLTAKSEHEHYKECEAEMQIQGEGTSINERDALEGETYGISIEGMTTLMDGRIEVIGRTNVGVSEVSIYVDDVLDGVATMYSDSNRFHYIIQMASDGAVIKAKVTDTDKVGGEVSVTLLGSAPIKSRNLRVDLDKGEITADVSSDISQVQLVVNGDTLGYYEAINGKLQIPIYVNPAQGDVVSISAYDSDSVLISDIATCVGYSVF